MSRATATLSADLHAHRLYAEHAGLPVGIVTLCAQNHTALAQAAWLAAAGATWAERAREFHEGGEEALFDLLGRATTRAERRAEYDRLGLWGRLGCAGTALDFGSGLGFSASLLRDAGRQVTCVDVDGAVLRFARWFLETTGQGDVDYRVTSFARAELPADQRFDLVLVEQVLEFVPDPAATAERLARAVAGGGCLLLQLDVRPESPHEPHRRALPLGELFAAAPTLRGMQRQELGDRGHHLFTAR